MTDKPKNEREEFKKRFGTGVDTDGYYIGGDLEGCPVDLEDIFDWHIQSQKRLLERVDKEVLIWKNLVYCSNPNAMLEVQRSKLQSLLKDLEDKGEKE